jgi:hypothetical protein
MDVIHRMFVIAELSELAADRSLVSELRRVEREGHGVADVRHEGGRWRIYAYDRRFHHDQGLTAFRRRITD